MKLNFFKLLRPFFIFLFPTFLVASERSHSWYLKNMFQQSNYVKIDVNNVNGLTLYMVNSYQVGRRFKLPKLLPCFKKTKDKFQIWGNDKSHLDFEKKYVIFADDLVEIIRGKAYKECWSLVEKKVEAAEKNICFSDYMGMESIPMKVRILAIEWLHAIQNYNAISSSEAKTQIDGEDLLAMASVYLKRGLTSDCSRLSYKGEKIPFGRGFLVQANGTKIHIRDYIPGLFNSRSIPGHHYFTSGAQNWIGQALLLRKLSDGGGWKVESLVYKKPMLVKKENLKRGEEWVLRNVRKYPHVDTSLLDFNLARMENEDAFYGRAKNDLIGLLKSKEKISKNQELIFLNDFVKILETLNKLGILHLDIKLDNILFYQEVDKFGKKIYRLKLTDFEYAILRDDLETTKNHLNGSEFYADHTAIKENIYNAKSDIWSMGITLFSFTYNRRPDEVLKDHPDFGKEIVVARYGNHPWNNLIQGMLRRDLNKRSTIEEIRREADQLMKLIQSVE